MSNSSDRVEPGQQQADQQFEYRYRFGNAEFDESTFQLFVDGQAVAAERKAFEVLACLLRHAGEVVTKQELFDEVWNGRVTVDKVLPNAINKLRKALGPGNAGLLVTQPRLGYRFTGVRERVVVRSRAAAQSTLAAGLAVHARPNFVLRQLLGGSQGSEAWLAGNDRTGERRVYKFGTGSGRLRSLRREATLARVLHHDSGSSARTPFARLLDWHFESPPFFLEYEYGGQDLLAWSKEHLADMPLPSRLALFLQVADAVAQAHRLGVLHKDIKPANILVSPAADGWQVCLTDFGSGLLLDPDRLEALGITRHDMMATLAGESGSASGTLMYLAPEVVAGQPQTAQGDVYALGVVLYQLAAGNLAQPMAPGWEKAIDDALLRDDIARATDGNPAHRFGNVPELIERLRRLEQRRLDADAAARSHRQQAQAREALARAQARRPFAIASMLLLATGLATSLWFHARSRESALAEQAAHEAARQELARAEALNAFITVDVIGRSNPVVAGRGADAPIREVLLAARERIGGRFESQPLVAANIHRVLADLFNSIELLEPAEEEIRASLALHERLQGPEHIQTVMARSQWINVLTRLSRFDEARQALETWEAGSTAAHDSMLHAYRSLAWGYYHGNQGAFDEALPYLEAALELLAKDPPRGVTELDAVRISLGQIYNRTGHPDKAAQLASDLQEDVRARDDGNELTIAVAMQILGDAYNRLDRYDEAEPLLLAAQARIVPILGEDSINNMMLLQGLSYVARKREDWPSAVAYAQQFAEGTRARLGDTHVMAVGAQGLLGQVLYISRDPLRAEAPLRASHEFLTQHHPADNPQAWSIAYWYAANSVALGKWTLAEQLLARLDEHPVEPFSSDPTQRAALSALRGIVLDARGRRQDARLLLEPAVAELERDPDVEMAATLAQARATLARL